MGTGNVLKLFQNSIDVYFWDIIEKSYEHFAFVCARRVSFECFGFFIGKGLGKGFVFYFLIFVRFA